MENILARCAGLDVHKESVEACVRRIEPNGRVHSETRHWGTMTRDLLEMADWLAAEGVTNVAMESTGVFWKPIFNILESRFTVLLVNARHLKQVPGRKSDVRDCQWIAQLLQCGLLKGSFIPSRTQRELRDLTRHRTQLVEEKTRTINRIQKVLEDANIKLASVATDIMGVSGRAMIHRLIEGETNPHKLADLAQRQLRGKIPELQKALEGKLTDHHRFLLKMLWKELAQQEELLAELDAKIEEHTRPFAAEIVRLDAIPGVDHRVAEVLLAEIGADLKPFPSDEHLSSWAGMCPGNEESAGKRRRRRITPGNRWLKKTLAQAGWAASHTKNSYLASQYRRLAGHRGQETRSDRRGPFNIGHFLSHDENRIGLCRLGRRFLRPSRTSALDPLLRQASRTPRSQGHARNRRRRLSKFSEQDLSGTYKPLVERAMGIEPKNYILSLADSTPLAAVTRSNPR
jgi:transposase